MPDCISLDSFPLIKYCNEYFFRRNNLGGVSYVAFEVAPPIGPFISACVLRAFGRLAVFAVSLVVGKLPLVTKMSLQGRCQEDGAFPSRTEISANTVDDAGGCRSRERHGYFQTEAWNPPMLHHWASESLSRGDWTRFTGTYSWSAVWPDVRLRLSACWWWTGRVAKVSEQRGSSRGYLERKDNKHKDWSRRRTVGNVLASVYSAQTGLVACERMAALSGSPWSVQVD